MVFQQFVISQALINTGAKHQLWTVISSTYTPSL